jgi:hypothetical protein
MAYLVTSDLYTVIYENIITEITRNDDTIVPVAIEGAISEARGYLSRYDTVQLFGDSETAPTVADAWLKNMVKDIAAWQVIKLANPDINYQHIRSCYEDAIATLTKVSSGKLLPNWPLYVPPTTTPDPGAAVQWSSNRKLTNDI